MLTTILDLLGALLVITATAWFVAGLVGIIAGVGLAGLLILGLSWLIDRRKRGPNEPV